MLYPTLSPRPPTPNTRLLVAQSGFLGDVVLTTPQAGPLLEQHPAVDRVLVDAKRAAGRGVLGLVRAARYLRRERFTLAVAPHKSLRTALLLTLAGIPQRIGFRQSPGWFLYHQTATRDPQRHEVERILCLMRAFGVEPEECGRGLRIECSAGARAGAGVLLREAGVGESEPVFMVCPGSVWPTKRWTVAGYAGLVRQLARDYGRVLICGGPDDTAVARAVYTQSGEQGVNLTGRTDLQTFMALIDRARVVVSNDSAPMHMAVARGVPVVAIFCATTPSLGYGPYSERAVVVEQKGLFCRPCSRHGGSVCPRGTEDCMRSITVPEVLAAVDHLLTSVVGPPAHAHL